VYKFLLLHHYFLLNLEAHQTLFECLYKNYKMLNVYLLYQNLKVLKTRKLLVLFDMILLKPQHKFLVSNHLLYYLDILLKGIYIFHIVLKGYILSTLELGKDHPLHSLSVHLFYCSEQVLEQDKNILALYTYYLFFLNRLKQFGQDFHIC